MLIVTIGATSSFDDEKQEFVELGGDKLQLEHSLVSLSKWESEFEKPFLSKVEKSREEALAYVRCMVISENPPEGFLENWSQENFDLVNAYIDRKMTATWFSEVRPEPRNSETITSELIYYWMTAFNIPFTCETWNLNRLFTLIRIANLKQGKPKKMTKAEIMQRNRELNAQRRAQLGSKG